MTTKQRLLTLLEQNKGQYFSGEELAQRFCVSRAAVWKAIQTLRQEGYAIDAATNRGYCLSLQGDILSAEGMGKYLRYAQLKPTVLTCVDSTNTRLRQLADQGAEEGTAILACQQTQGRGRMGRSFYSPGGTGLYLSLLLRPRAYDPQQATDLTALAAVAMCQAMEEVFDRRPQIKWVNDLLLEGRKICGILTEGAFSVESGALEYLVLGVGVNMTAPEAGFPEELAAIAGPLLETGEDDGKNRLAAEFLNRFWEGYLHPENRQFVEQYRRRSMVIGKQVTAHWGSESRPALVLGIDDACRLLVRWESGETQTLSYGEISVKV